jgi:mannose-6-phosphate isomerase class I
MPTLKDLVERRKRTADESVVLQEEVAKIVKSLNDLAANGRDLEAAGLMPDAEKNPELQAAIQNFRQEFGFKTEVEQAAMKFGRLQKRIPVAVKRSRTAPEHLRDAIQTLSIQVRQFDKKVQKSGLRSEDIQEVTGFEAKLADLEPQLESVA